eukprot:m.71813 g.71813  ORF g.71813 m.71813 type:complete len:70 (+) comp24394_c0_seq3:125-334(+)
MGWNIGIPLLSGLTLDYAHKKSVESISSAHTFNPQNLFKLPLGYSSERYDCSIGRERCSPRRSRCPSSR